MCPTENFATDQEADAFLRSKLDPKWLKRPQSPDFHVDYVVEMDEGGEPSGEKFAVQLKGTKAAKYVGSELSFKLSTKHLAYYVDRSPEPVFLVVVDLARGKGHWLFLQRYAQERLKDWRGQKTVTVRLPVDNCIDDRSTLRKAASDAVAHMRELRPSSVAASVSGLEETLESLDNRFSVKVSHASGVTKVELDPRANVQAGMKFKTPDAARKFQESLITGAPTDFKSSDIDFVGSPIFEKIKELSKADSFSLQSAKKLPCQCSFFERLSEDKERMIIPQASGEVAIGLEEAHLVVGLENAPLAISIDMVFGDDNTIRESNFGVQFIYEAWVGQPLALAAHFERVADFIKCTSRRAPVAVGFEIEGNSLFKATINAHETDTLSTIDSILDVIGRARRVGNHVGANPPLPGFQELVAGEPNILLLASLIDGGVHVDQIVKGGGTLTHPDAAVALAELERAEAAGGWSLNWRYCETPSLLGSPLSNWGLFTVVTGMEITDASKKQLKEAAASSSAIEMNVEATSASVRYTKLGRMDEEPSWPEVPPVAPPS